MRVSVCVDVFNLYYGGRAHCGVECLADAGYATKVKTRLMAVQDRKGRPEARPWMAGEGQERSCAR